MDVCVGLLHPGAMGAAVGQLLTARGYAVWWASEGRSGDSASRAAAAGLRDAGSLAALAARSGVILSICPPHAALDVAARVAATGYRGLYVDANAIAPATARRIPAVVSAARVVDGALIGAPPGPSAATRLYLSGDGAEEVQRLFAGTPLQTRALPGGIGAASAVKMAYAAWSKGSAALLLCARALAQAEGVDEALLAEWRLSMPGLSEQHDRAVASAQSKGWRWVGEMEEIAAAMAERGLPSGFHRAAADVFHGEGRAAAAGLGQERGSASGERHRG